MKKYEKVLLAIFGSFAALGIAAVLYIWVGLNKRRERQEYADVFVIYSVISVICNIPIVVDIVLETIGIVGVAISTINIKVN